MPRSNEWGETLEKTIIRSRAQLGLLVYSMVDGEVIEVGINGNSPDGVALDQSRIITARSQGLQTGALEVIEDTSEADDWTHKVICLGSYAFGFSGIEIARARLMRGFIAHNAGVVVDLSAEHFVGASPPSYLMAEYSTLSLEGERIF